MQTNVNGYVHYDIFLTNQMQLEVLDCQYAFYIFSGKYTLLCQGHRKNIPLFNICVVINIAFM